MNHMWILVSTRMTACAEILRGADIQKEQLLSTGESTYLGIELGGFSLHVPWTEA